MATYDMWAFYGSGLIPQVGGNDLQGGLNGTTYTAGTDFDFANYGTMQMVDGNNDGLLRDSDTDGTIAGTDRVITPDGATQTINEVAIYSNTVISYLDFDGNPRTWTMALTVWQTDLGDAIFRINNSLNSSWPTDFFPGNIVSLTLGTWDGVEYGAASVSSHLDQPFITCFASGTQISTRCGDVMVERLQVGDEVLTLDDGYQPIRWIGAKVLSADVLKAAPNLQPVRIRAGALGIGQPLEDLVVSPQHRVLSRSAVSKRMFGPAEVLVAAKHLLPLDGVEIADDLAEVTYWHILFDKHQIVFSNGAATESLFTGPEALKSLSPEAREEMSKIFPDLPTEPVDMVPVRRLVPGRFARKFTTRVALNRKLLIG